ncbi:MAG: sugar phosphate isomerase/epimerase [Oscillospiraceae bacterium]|nr:sugar phosphate isomerase/epimerase [Oscillospiraceae bacterium]
MFRISGFFDEAASKLDAQLALMNELNVRYLCPRGIDGKNIADYTPESFSGSVRPRLAAAGASLSSIGSPIGKISLGDEAAYQAQLKKLSALRDIAGSSGCRYIRIFSFYMKPGFDEDAAFPQVIEKLRGFLNVIRGRDIILLHENEKKIFGDTPDRVMRLFNALDNPQFALCYDASNYLQIGADPWDAYMLTRDATAYYHMKDCQDGFEVPLGEGQGRIKDILADLLVRGFDGFLTLEPHTVKYALMRRPLRILPFVSPGIARACRDTDKRHGVTFANRVTRADVFRWQHENLVNILSEVGGTFE